MNRHPHIRLSDVIMGLSSALDLVNWFLVNHHRQVTSMAVQIASEIGMSDEDRSNVAIAAALHDIGAISFNEKFNLGFDADEGVMKHAELGYHLLSEFRPFHSAAEMVRYHHVPWDGGRGAEYGTRRVPLGSHVIHLADRAAVLIRSEEMILKRTKSICDTIRQESNKKFIPELVQVFLHLAGRESFWLNAVHAASDFTIEGCTAAWNIELDMRLLRSLSDLFRMIIDFRTPLTATHSNDVANLSAAIARLFGFSDHEADTLHIAGNLHDLGKLSVPVEILEKAGPMSEDETFVMRAHSFHTYRILKKIGGLDEINIAASMHHECLDGTGYPFRSSSALIPFTSRIVAVADILSALTENRSYRTALDYDQALQILNSMAKANKLDNQIVALVERNRAELQDVQQAASDEGLREFRKIKSEADRGIGQDP